jgi:para-nitrobenzyl esterase
MLTRLKRMLAAGLLWMAAACTTHPGKVDHVRFASDARSVMAATRAGTVRGVEGAEVRAFLGLPYAAAPVGTLRWRVPRPVEPWDGVRDATRPGADCVQALGRRAILGGGGGLVTGSEDCLYANIYAPAGEPTRPRPVMVYVHGGAFTIGAGVNYDPSRLALSQDRVVVTFNYRLGALGWLAHPGLDDAGEGLGGNFGLMDQQAALRWVRDNIAAFGGDPEDVTLFAESSGAWSACYLMASPGSEGLFHRVILQSAGCLEPSSLPTAQTAAEDGRLFAVRLGCDGEGAANCLRALPAWRVARARSSRSGINGPGSWGPVFGDAVVPLSPPEAFASGRFTRVPAIVGTNADEGRLFAVEVRSLDRYEKETVWMYGAHGRRVLERYPIEAEGPAATIARSFTDQRFACPSEALRRLLARHVRVHGYEFADRQAPFIAPDWLTGLDMGAYHAGELAYVFGTSWLFADAGRFTPAQRALSERMMRLWAGFGHDPDFEDRWPRIDGGGDPVLVFDPAGDRFDDAYAERRRCDFWATTPFGPVSGTPPAPPA